MDLKINKYNISNIFGFLIGFQNKLSAQFCFSFGKFYDHI